MSAGFLADLGLDSVEADPNAIPDGKYAAYVYDAKIVAYKDTSKGKALVLTYKIAPGSIHSGKTVDEWKSCNKFDDARSKGYLKQRILSLGVPENRMADLDPNDLKGTAVYITTKKNGEYTNARMVEVRDESTTAPNQVSADEWQNGTSSAASSSDVSDLL